MHNHTHGVSENGFKVLNSALEQNQLDELTELANEIGALLILNSKILKEAGVKKEMQRLEDWLDEERKGPAPAKIISNSGVSWLEGLRDRLKLAAYEVQCLEGEGGIPSNRKQAEELEELLRTIKRINGIIQENTTTTGANAN